MKNFFSTFFAALLGSFVSAILLFIVFVGIIVGIASMGESEVKIKPKTVLHLDLNGSIVDRASSNPFDQLSQFAGSGSKTIGLNELIESIEKASRDENISGILLESGQVSAGYATIEEIRNALLEFKKSGKFIISHAPFYTQKSYYLATAADKIYLPPVGMVEFAGIHAQSVFFKGMLDKIGVEMQIIRHGKFKSAVEPFMVDKMSDASRLQTEVYVNSIWNSNLEKISQQRNLTVQQLNEIADLGVMFNNPEILVERRLVDALKYKDEVIDEVKTTLGIEQKDDIQAVSVSKYAKVFVAKKEKGIAKDKIAIIYAEGEIDGSSSGINSEKLSKTIRAARRDSSIKAIVLRVNSPGGAALGSDLIWREVKLARETKPFVVSMGDLAASGGYYISCAADSIVAQPTTITGSIGIFGTIPNTEGLMKKVGISMDGIKTNKYSGMPDMTRPFTKEESAILQNYIEIGYNTFISRCAEGRHTTTALIDSVGQGRVWSGVNALEIGLVDKLGGIADAVDIAKRMANLDKYRIVSLPEQEDPFTELLKGMSGEVQVFFGKMIFGSDYEYLKVLKSFQGRDQIQARMPYDISLN